jgi:CubicO group peptidase (beta-lactamase class C family)
MPKSGNRSIGWVAALLAVALTAPSVEAAGPTNTRELESFLDGFFAAAMNRYDVPGLVFSMVKDGDVFLAKGYGMADLETGRPVDPSKTLFRVASVSKLSTATAVLQLAERGKLDLHRDVNAYLTGLQLPSTFPEPITLAHLLTHTAGFDERVFGMDARTRADLRPMADYLADRMPDRVLPPGDVFSYSNHGLGLAGLIVQEVSGMPFGRYTRENIFEPLGMTRTAFSLPPKLEPDLAVGYVYRDYENQPVPYDYLQMLAPAGSLLSTGADMARFMLAHLRDGRLGEVRILKAETAQLMHSQQFTHHPKLPGSCYGFRESFVNVLVLDLEADLGFFVSYNALSDDGRENGLHMELVQALYGRYFPAASPPMPEPPAGFLSRASRFTGSYRHNRYIRDSFGKLAAFVGEIRVTAEPDGTLRVYPKRPYLDPVSLVEVGDLVFERGDGGGYAVFRQNEKGEITHLFVDFFGPAALDKLPVLESAYLHLRLIVVVVFLLLSGIVGWPLAYWLRRPRPAHPCGARAARWIAVTMGLLTLYAIGAVWVELNGPTMELSYGVPDRLVWLLRLPFLTTLLTLAMALCTVQAWRSRWWSRAARLHYTAITLGALMLIPLELYWKLFGSGP